MPDACPGTMLLASPVGTTYLQFDARDIAEQWSSERFDLTTACMVLPDTSHAGDLLRAAYQVRAPSGRIAISFPHPATTGPNAGWAPTEDGHKGVRQIDHYFATRPGVLDWRMARLAQHGRTPQWHRTLEEWSALMEAAGLGITRMVEPRPRPEQLAANPSLVPASRIPFSWSWRYATSIWRARQPRAFTSDLARWREPRACQGGVGSASAAAVSSSATGVAEPVSRVSVTTTTSGSVRSHCTSGGTVTLGRS